METNNNPQGTILHVTESLGGGVASAITSYALSTPEFNHVLLASVRSDTFAENKVLPGFSKTISLPRKPLQARKLLRSVCSEFQPSAVHAHSSLGGVLTRLSLRARPTRPLVYSPHGYAFERRDISWVARTFYHAVEAILSFNTSVIAACSPREADLSKRFPGRVIYVPNVASDTSPTTAELSAYESDRPINVVSVGRFVAARNPSLYLGIVEHCRKQGLPVTFKWIGDGDSAQTDRLRSLDADVTGWLPNSEVRSLLADADVLFHCSAWDGFPMAILEAYNAGLPVITTDIPAFSHIDQSLKIRSPEDFSRWIVAVLSEPDLLHKNLTLWSTLLSENTAVVQGTRLLDVYTSRKSWRKNDRKGSRK